MKVHESFIDEDIFINMNVVVGDGRVGYVEKIIDHTAYVRIKGRKDPWVINRNSEGWGNDCARGRLKKCNILDVVADPCVINTHYVVGINPVGW